MIGAGCELPDWRSGTSVVMSCESDAMDEMRVRGNVKIKLIWIN